ncbi:MAG: Uncharacterized protein XD91_1646 [Clostridiales bacterium 38_11]|nr:MAG: Uncharacterized protein XD91_1646 [Clostridiales bacterium 38_11]
MKRLNNKGGALVTVLLVFLILIILGSAVLFMSVSENRFVAVQEKSMKSYYVARSGADAIASHLIINPSDLDSFIAKTKVGPAEGSIDGRPFETYVTGYEHEFIIESIAYTLDGQEGSRVYLTMREFNLLDHAIFANQILDTGNNVTINGNIGTNSESIEFGSNLVNGNVTLGPLATPSDISDAEDNIASDFMVNQLSVPLVYPEIDPVDFPITIPSGTTDINTNDYTLDNGKLKGTLDKINISGNANTQFYAHGGGQVHIYITGSITFGGSANADTDEDTKLFLYYDKSDAINFNGGPGANVTIYAPNATINFNGGGNEPVNGSFICDKFVGPDSNVTITQGNGTMADLIIDGVAGYHRAVWSN